MPDERKSRYPGCYPSGKSNWQWKLRLPPNPDTGKRPIETRGGYATEYAAHLARSARQVELGLGVNTAPSDLTVTQAVEQWIAGRTMKPASRFQYAYLTRRFITPHIGTVRVRELTPARVRAWQVLLLARGRQGDIPLAASTVSNCRALLSSTLDQLRRDGSLPRNVVDHTDGVTIPRHRADTWTLAEAQTFLVTSDADDYAALWRLGLLSLLRPGELVALRWNDIDLSRGVVTIAQTATRDSHGRWMAGEPKTPASAAPVGLSAVTVTQLRHLHDAQRLTGKHRPDEWRHDLVFPNRLGAMLTHSSLSARLATLCKRAGVPALTSHELRHTGSNLMIRAGVDPTTLTRALRHERPEFSMRIYQVANLRDQQGAVTTLETALEGDRTPSQDTRTNRS